MRILSSLLVFNRALASTPGPAVTGEIEASSVSHVVVIPDTHGDGNRYIDSLYLAYREVEKDAIPLTEFARIMVQAVSAQELPERPLSSKRDVILVQLGDLVDRGPDSMECILMTRAIPRVIGWETVSLFGNHEIMSSLGYEEGERMVHPDDAAVFGGMQGRNEAYSPNIEGNIFHELKLRSLGIARLQTRDRKTGPRNPATLFVHGGMDLGWAHNFFPLPELDYAREGAVRDINNIFREMVSSEAGREALSHHQSILWTRVLAEQPESVACRLVDEIRYEFRVARIIVGHTPQSDLRVKTRCDGKIILADAMISAWMAKDYDGNSLSIVMTMDRDKEELTSIDVIYVNHRESLFHEPMSARGRALMPLNRLDQESPTLKKVRTSQNLAAMENDENAPP